MLRNALFGFCVLVSGVSCAANRDGDIEYFKATMNHSVGKSIGLWGNGGFGPPSLIATQSIDDKKEKYIYRVDKSGCEWFFTVDKRSKLVLAWGYISRPDKCYVETNWLGPW